MSPPKDPIKLKEYVKKQRESHLGVLNHNYKPKSKVICQICSRIFFDTPKHAESRVCCSVKCYKIYQSRKQHGVGNNFFGRTHTFEVTENIRIAQTGRLQSDSTKKKRRESLQKVVHTQEWKDNQSASLKGREITWTEKISAAHQGIPLDEWEGYTTPLYHKIRTSQEYYAWRLAVFERDNFCDRITGVKGNGNLNAHHIVPFASILEQNNIKTFEDALKCEALWDINNGLTMIDTNHAAFHSKEEMKKVTSSIA